MWRNTIRLDGRSLHPVGFGGKLGDNPVVGFRMRFRFRKSFSIVPGVRINVGLKGLSANIGVRGANVGIGPRGARLNLGIPGSGVGVSVPFGGLGTPVNVPQPAAPSPVLEPMPSPTPNYFSERPDEEYRSASVSQLQSTSMSEFLKYAIEIEDRRKELKKACAEAEAEANSALRASTGLMAALRKVVSPQAHQERMQYADATAKFLADIKEQLDRCRIKLDLGIDGATEAAWLNACRAFESVKNSLGIWDIEARTAVDRVKTRSAASNSLTMEPVRFGTGSDDVFDCPLPVLRLGNSNGATIRIYPTFLLVGESINHSALIDFRDAQFEVIGTRFIADTQPPSDAVVVDHTWEKVNKNGTRDRRFVDNRQIPVVDYLKIRLTAKTGLNEAWMVSRSAAGRDFFAALDKFRGSLRGTEEQPAVQDALPEGVDGENEEIVSPEPPKADFRTPMAAGAILAVLAGGVYGVYQLSTSAEVATASRGAAPQNAAVASVAATAAVATQPPRVEPAEVVTPPWSPPRALTVPEIKELQGYLKKLGLYNGSVDGQVGSGTLSGLRKFAEPLGLPSSPAVNDKQLGALRAAAALVDQKPGTAPLKPR